MFLVVRESVQQSQGIEVAEEPMLQSLLASILHWQKVMPQQVQLQCDMRFAAPPGGPWQIELHASACMLFF